MPIPSPSPNDRSKEPHHPLLRGLERASRDINPFLTILAIGIGILDLTCYMGIVGSRQITLHSTAHAASVATPAPDMNPIDYGR
jgi:hypothetical protein